MAITRYTINGDLSALKAALEETDFFNSVSYDNDTTPTKVCCYDADNNLIFESSASGCTAYKSDGTYTGTSGSSNYGSPTYLFTVGTNSALIQYANAKGNPSACTAIGKTNNGAIGFAFPVVLGATSANANINRMNVATWEDQGDMTTVLQIAADTPMVGNSTLLVPIPMHGKYGESITMKNVYFMPMTQSGMRNALQEIISADGKVYLTNGYIAALDNEGLSS